MGGPQTNFAAMSLPRYECHKKVSALKIAEAQNDIDGGVTITPVEEGFAPFTLSAEWAQKHQPEVGGYVVVYVDGYVSYSPAKAFEDGYTRIEG